MTTLYEVHGSVAVITLSNPPVNGLGYATRLSITDNLQKANADAAVTHHSAGRHAKNICKR